MTATATARCTDATASAGEAAAAWLAAHGLPAATDEDWKQTPIDRVLAIPFQLPPRPDTNPLSRPAVADLAGDLGGPRFVFVNGRAAPELSTLDRLPATVKVASLAAGEADPGEARRHGPVPAEEPRHGFAALNAALADDGALVEVPAGVAVDVPIHLVFVTVPGAGPLVSSPRCAVVARAGSRATVVETYVGVPGEIYLTNAVTTVVLDEGATVTHGKLQDESEAGFHLASLEVRQGRESRFDTHSIALGAALARHEVTVQLGGTGAEAHVHGLLAPRGEQHHANPTTVDHASPGCASRQSSVGVIDGRGQGVSDGRVVVRPGADGTDAHQITRNLLLTDAAQVATRPRLEIHAEDVRCTHGATVGHLDEDAVFYLRSRGIPHQAARSVLVQAFTAEAIGRLPVPALRSRVEHAVARRLGLGG